MDQLQKNCSSLHYTPKKRTNKKITYLENLFRVFNNTMAIFPFTVTGERNHAQFINPQNLFINRIVQVKGSLINRIYTEITSERNCIRFPRRMTFGNCGNTKPVVVRSQRRAPPFINNMQFKLCRCVLCLHRSKYQQNSINIQIYM